MYLLKKRVSLLLVCFYFSISTANAQTLKITGLPINIGDTLEQVQQAMQTSATPAPYESKINPNGTRMPFSTKGIIVFFDAAGKVAIIRLEKNFAGDINGLKYGAGTTAVTERLGVPLTRAMSKEGIETLTYELDNRVNFEYNRDKALDVVYLRKPQEKIPKSTALAATPITPIPAQVSPAPNLASTGDLSAVNADHSAPSNTVTSPSPSANQTTTAVQAIAPPAGNQAPQSNSKMRLALFVTGNTTYSQSDSMDMKRNLLNNFVVKKFHENKIPTRGVTLQANDNYQTAVIKAAFALQASHIIRVHVPQANVRTTTRYGAKVGESVGIYTVTASVFDVAAQKEIYKYTSENDSKGLFLGISDEEAGNAIFNDMKSKGIF
jgi:hypothetical protein